MCRSRRELSNAYFLAKFGLDAAENEPRTVLAARRQACRATTRKVRRHVPHPVRRSCSLNHRLPSSDFISHEISENRVQFSRHFCILAVAAFQITCIRNFLPNFLL